MSRISVIGGTGFAGAAIVRQAAARGHDVTVLSTSEPKDPVAGVTYEASDATDPEALRSVIAGTRAEVVVAALSPRGPLAPHFRDVNRVIAEQADAAGSRLYVVGGYSSLRPSPGADRFVSDLSDIPPEARDEVLAGAALIIEDLPATPESLQWVFVSPAYKFGSFAPSEPLGRYQLGGDVAVDPATGGVINVDDYALGFLDLIESGEHLRTQVNIANPA